MLRSHMQRALIIVSVALLAVAIGGLTTAVQAHAAGHTPRCGTPPATRSGA
jgi:hypothetical protein